MKKTLIAASLFTSLFAAQAYAAGDAGFYAGAKVGYAHAGFGNGDVGGTAVDKNVPAAGALVGYQFDKTWAAEVSWDYLGNVDYRGGDVRSDSINIAGIGKYPLCEKAYAFGKLGLGTGYTKANADGVASENNRNVGAIFGGGLGYKVDDHYEIRGEWARYDNVGVKSGNVGQGNVDLATVTGIYHF